MNTPENITELPQNAVFVFGSNAQGSHGAGAAKVAHQKFGYPWGVSTGLIGQAYGIDTMSGVDKFEEDARRFLHTAESLPAITFYLTRVGTGIAGYTESEVAPLFRNAPGNVIKPEGWE